MSPTGVHTKTVMSIYLCISRKEKKKIEEDKIKHKKSYEKQKNEWEA